MEKNMQVDLLEFMIELLRHRAIQVLLLEGDPRQAEKIDYGFRRRMAAGFDYARIPEQLQQMLQEGIQYFLKDDLGLFYTLFRFPQKSFRVLCIGPVLPRRMEGEHLFALMQEKEISPSYHRDFMEFYNRIPLIADVDAWNRKVNFCLEKLMGHPIPFKSGSLGHLLLGHADYSLPDMPDMALSLVEERYRWEDEMLAAVSTGNLELALEAHYRFKQYKLLPRTADPLRDRKNLLFTFNTLLRKSAQAGKVHPLHIDNLSTQFAIQIESTMTVEKLDALSVQMLRRYCMLVQNFSRRSHSRLIRSCMDAIDFHYSEEISLASLARDHCVSPSYLSALFKKETGSTITDYINTTRIRQALTLLNTSSLSIGVIAARCGFPDANYFTRIFKKYQQTTPKAYRERIRNVPLPKKA
ncbi:MAG: helix-turn-helix transcriptional regulator [Provencibacterium sp.]|jgi:two-component system response regulator YesN|nr:helix-turn-helix transcriptional regulator [Provencibacterium sp.]